MVRTHHLVAALALAVLVSSCLPSAKPVRPRPAVHRRPPSVRLAEVHAAAGFPNHAAERDYAVRSHRQRAANCECRHTDQRRIPV